MRDRCQEDERHSSPGERFLPKDKERPARVESAFAPSPVSSAGREAPKKPQPSTNQPKERKQT